MEEVKKYYAPEDGRLLDKGTCNSTDIPNSLIFRNHETKMVGVFPLAGIKDDSSKNGSNKGGNSINKSLGNDISKNDISEGEYYDTKNPYIFEDYHIRNSLNGPTFIALKKGHFKWGLMMVCLRSWKDDSYSSLDQKEIDLINFFSEKGCMKDVYPWNKCKLYEYKWVLPFEYQLERIVMMVEMK